VRRKWIREFGVARATPIHTSSITLVQAVATTTLWTSYDVLFDDFCFGDTLGHGESA
jgi:hypothetical protein